MAPVILGMKVSDLNLHISKNKNVLIYVDGELLHRNDAKISVFDSGFMMGDGIWEGLRLSNNQWLFLDEHLERLFEGAKAIDLEIGLTTDELVDALTAEDQAALLAEFS